MGREGTCLTCQFLIGKIIDYPYHVTAEFNRCQFLIGKIIVYLRREGNLWLSVNSS